MDGAVVEVYAVCEVGVYDLASAGGSVWKAHELCRNALEL